MFLTKTNIPDKIKKITLKISWRDQVRTGNICTPNAGSYLLLNSPIYLNSPQMRRVTNYPTIRYTESFLFDGIEPLSLLFR